jgi:hypothetical protein
MKVSGELHTPAALPPGKQSPGTRWIGVWMGPRAGLDAVKYRDCIAPVESRTSAVQPVARLYTDLRTPYGDQG